MTTPAYPNAISLLDLQNEFGGSNPIGMNEYYAGAGIVPNGTINGSGDSIPSSGSLDLSMFRGSQQVPNPLPVRVLIIGGGGGGARRGGSDNAAENGGAGAGGYVDATFNLPKGSYSIPAVGGGGYGSNGGDTVAFGYRAYGGGYGGPSDSGAGAGGGSGGGAAERTGSYGSSIQPNPTSGDYGNQPAYGNNGSGGPHGGGGGAGSAASGGYGGSGRQWINGTYYAGGGGSSFGYSGGAGGGGSATGNGTYYGGGGGGAPSGGSSPWVSTSGYQGIVIVSYQWNFQVLSGGTVTSDSGTGFNKRWYHAITDTSNPTTISY